MRWKLQKIQTNFPKIIFPQKTSLSQSLNLLPQLRRRQALSHVAPSLSSSITTFPPKNHPLSISPSTPLTPLSTTYEAASGTSNSISGQKSLDLWPFSISSSTPMVLYLQNVQAPSSAKSDRISGRSLHFITRSFHTLLNINFL